MIIAVTIVKITRRERDRERDYNISPPGAHRVFQVFVMDGRALHVMTNTAHDLRVRGWRTPRRFRLPSTVTEPSEKWEINIFIESFYILLLAE